MDTLVGDVVSTRREIARLQAAEARLLAGAAELVSQHEIEYRERTGTFGSDLPLREVSLELGAAMRVSDRTVQARLGDAVILVGMFPRTFAAWESGTIDAGHAWALVRAGTVIRDQATRERYEELALAAAETESPGRIAGVARAIAAALDPDAFAERLAATGAERRVRLYDLDDGMARLIADLPAPIAYAIRERLIRLAEEAVAGDATEQESPAAGKEADVPDGNLLAETRGTRQVPRCAVPERDQRTADQVRADVFADLLLTGVPTAHGNPEVTRTITGRIQVTVPATTLAAVPGGPALLAGYGPIDPTFAREFAGAAPTSTTTARPPTADRRGATTSRTSVGAITLASTTPRGGCGSSPTACSSGAARPGGAIWTSHPRPSDSSRSRWSTRRRSETDWARVRPARPR